MTNKTVLIFGVFDGIHEGHLSFIREAKEHGDRLVAVVARDEMVEKMKGKLPKNNQVERINFLLNTPNIDLVLLGDQKKGTYNSIKEINPDIIYIGYDQNELFDDIKKRIKNGELNPIEILKGKPYKPEIFHSSLLNK